MSTAIDFAVRNAAGGLQNGAVSGDGFSETIVVNAGDNISLNISQASVVAYRHEGGNLVIELVDGRVIVLDGWYEQPMGAQTLYLSSNGDLQQVYLMDSGDGSLFASYAPVETVMTEKWSPLDGLRHDQPDMLAGYVSGEDEPAGMGMFLPGLVGGTFLTRRVHHGLARKKWRAPTEEPGGVLWETGTDRRRSFGVKRCGWH